MGHRIQKATVFQKKQILHAEKKTLVLKSEKQKYFAFSGLKNDRCGCLRAY
jgi:hypothetical protein